MRGDFMSNKKTEVDYWFEDKETPDFDEMEPLLLKLAGSLHTSIKDSVKNQLLKSVLNHYQDCVDKIEELNVANDKTMQQVFYLGFISAIIQTESVNSKNKVIDEKWNHEISYNKHLVDLLSLLYTNNTLSKEKAMEKLNIKQSAMSNLYNNTKAMNLYISKKYGRNVVYYITDEGREYYKYIAAGNKALAENEGDTDRVISLLDIINAEKLKANPRGKDILEELENQGIKYSKPMSIEVRLNALLNSNSEKGSLYAKVNYVDAKIHIF